MQSTLSHTNSLSSVLILSFHMRLGLPSGFFPSRLPTNFLHDILISPMRATFLVHFILLYLITLITVSEAYKTWNSFLHPYVASSLSLSFSLSHVQTFSSAINNIQ